MASSSKRQRKHDVFLSFHGEDVRNNLVSHLYNALEGSGINGFLDSKELIKGDPIESAIMESIEESSAAIIIFSKNYASSTYCLNEVVKIMECKDLKVFPVFYKVDPDELTAEGKSYERAMARHEFVNREKANEVRRRWKNALFKAADICGESFDQKDESKLIRKIVTVISIWLDQRLLHVAKHPVGIDSQVDKLKLMLNIESDDRVLMVGLWGPGGIGKSSLAKALCNAICRRFDGSSYLANVREMSKGCKGLASLQGILLKDILLLPQKFKISSVDRGIELIRRRLCCRKILLILDDVDHFCQLDALASEREWFKKGSRIIITTRNRDLLIRHRMDHVYEVKALDNTKAQELLCKHAFPADKEFKNREELVHGILNHAQGFPLALEVLGSFLRDQGERAWESTRRQLPRIPNKDINDVLKISYVGLQEDHKEMFLHVACFFRGWDIEDVKKILNSCDLEATIGLKILIDRSLIMSNKDNTLEMHDIIQLMGKNIVNEDCQGDPKRRSRLWLYEDFLDVQQHQGDCAVKAIMLQPSRSTKIDINHCDFTKMRKLRLLIMKDVSCQGPICLPNKLRWFRWDGCASRIPEFSAPKEIVGLDMRKSSTLRVPNQIEEFQNLKYINFSYCESMDRMPDLSCTPNLEELDLRNCKNLVDVHESIACHDKLQVLILKDCSALSDFPNELKSKSLRTLDLEKCKKLARFPDIPQKLEGLENLDLRETAIKGLPKLIENLVSLKKMDISDCKNLESLPSSIYMLKTLEELLVERCTKLIEFPKYEDSADVCMESLRSLSLAECKLSKIEFLESPSCFPLLRHLDLSMNNFTRLPSMKNYHHLSQLAIQNCHQLQEIPELPPFFRHLWADTCESLQKSGHTTLIHYFVRRGLTTADISPVDQAPPDFNIFLRGREMPNWIQPIEKDFISFMASKDMYDKFLGLVFCFVLDDVEPDEEPMFEILPDVDDEKKNCKKGQAQRKLDSKHLWLRYFTPYDLWGEVNFDENVENHIQFGLAVSTTNVKNSGLRIICKSLEDDLKTVLQSYWPQDLRLPHEVIL